MKYANITTQEFADSLPTMITSPAGVTFNPTWGQLVEIGWRNIISIEEPREGFRVLRYEAVDVDGSDCNVIIAEDQDIALAEQERQDAKSPALKQIETGYCNFLETSWTTLLRSKSMIAEDYTITVENTDSTTNTTYLLTLMQTDLASYTPMSAIFLGFKAAIEGLGGTMADCVKHL